MTTISSGNEAVRYLGEHSSKLNDEGNYYTGWLGSRWVTIRVGEEDIHFNLTDIFKFLVSHPVGAEHVATFRDVKDISNRVSRGFHPLRWLVDWIQGWWENTVEGVVSPPLSSSVSSDDGGVGPAGVELNAEEQAVIDRSIAMVGEGYRAHYRALFDNPELVRMIREHPEGFAGRAEAMAMELLTFEEMPAAMIMGRLSRDRSSYLGRIHYGGVILAAGPGRDGSPGGYLAERRISRVVSLIGEYPLAIGVETTGFSLPDSIKGLDPDRHPLTEAQKRQNADALIRGLQGAVRVVEERAKAGDHVFVHCYQGSSRTGAVMSLLYARSVYQQSGRILSFAEAEAGVNRANPNRGIQSMARDNKEVIEANWERLVTS